MANTVTYDDLTVLYDALAVTYDGEVTARTASLGLRGGPRLTASAQKASSTAVTLRGLARTPIVAGSSAAASVALTAAGSARTVTQRAALGVVVLRGTGAGAVAGEAMELQAAPPVADLAAGGWANELGSAVGLYASIDEASPTDADYVQSSLSPLVVDEVRLILAGLDAPGTSEQHVVRYRYGKDAPGGDRIDLVVRLYAADGSTVIAEQTHPDISTLIDGALVLTEAEAGAIPDADYAAGLVLGLRAVKV